MVVRKTIPKRIVSKKLVSENRFIRKKKYIDPYIKFKDKKSRKILESLDKDVLLHETLRYATFNIFKNLINNFKKKEIDFLNNKNIQNKTHFLLPLTGMYELGLYLKPIFEELFPHARVDFILTPKSLNSLDLKISESVKLKNVAKDLKEIVSSKDSYFVVIDKMGVLSTFNLIKENIQNLGGNIFYIDVLKEHYFRYLEDNVLSKNALFYKSKNGTYSYPYYFRLKGEERRFEKRKFEVISYFLKYNGQFLSKILKDMYKTK